MLAKKISLNRKFWGWIFFGLAYFLIAPIYIRESICVPQKPDTWTIERNKQTAQANNDSKKINKIIAPKKKQPDSKDNKADNDNYRILERPWFCGEAKSTDIALVYFTFALVIVGWFTMRSAEDNMRRAERAYVVAGGPYGSPKKGKSHDDIDPHFKTAFDFNEPRRLILHNFGKTLAYIVDVRWGLCSEKRFRQFPSETKVSDMLENGLVACLIDYPMNVFPSMGLGEYYTYRHVAFDRSKYVGQVFYGKVSYRDVFGGDHHCTFALLLTKDGHSTPIGGYVEDST